MSVFKCKMCGGTIEFEPGASVGICDFCGTKQTLPKLDDEKKANLYDRADHFRRNNDYDKAAAIYEHILNEDGTDAETYWLLLLCRYGIEYVEDPATHRRIPTVNRAQYTSILADEDYKSALQYADGYQKSIYEAEAREIDGIQKGILEISQKEEPFDVFICYKETDAGGRRTRDSVLANDLYHQLTQEGFKVFFSRITLEEKLGIAYEPYIFAALNSAKVMVVLGTRPEYFNAVWVKNEWSRYLALIKNGAKKTLIPAYRDMDPYDLPEEFGHLQAQDMSKLGFMQDLIRGIKKITCKDTDGISARSGGAVKEAPVRFGAADYIEPLLERVFMFLEDGKWTDANTYCEKVLDRDPKNWRAYLGKLLAEMNCRTVDEIRDSLQPLSSFPSYNKVLRFGEEDIIKKLGEYATVISRNIAEAKKEKAYSEALALMNNASSSQSWAEAAKAFDALDGYRNSRELSTGCRRKMNEAAEEERRKQEQKERLEKLRSLRERGSLIKQEIKEKEKSIETTKGALRYDRKHYYTIIYWIISFIFQVFGFFIVAIFMNKGEPGSEMEKYAEKILWISYFNAAGLQIVNGQSEDGFEGTGAILGMNLIPIILAELIGSNPAFPATGKFLLILPLLWSLFVCIRMLIKKSQRKSDIIGYKNELADYHREISEYKAELSGIEENIEQLNRLIGSC